MASVRFTDDGSFFRLEVDDFASFHSAVGEEVLAAFCRCFVHADRLTSLVHFIRLLEQHCPQNSVAATRDLHTMVWFAVGTLREYAKAIQKLRSTLAKEGTLQPNSAGWKHLRDVEGRWEGDRYFIDFRDHLAFHVDPQDKIIPRGLKRLEQVKPVNIYLDDKPEAGTQPYGHWYRLGIESIFRGFGIRETDFEALFEQVAKDMAVNKSLFDVFRATLNQKGVDIVDGRKNARARRRTARK